MPSPMSERKARSSEDQSASCLSCGIWNLFPHLAPRVDCKLSRLCNDTAEVRRSKQTQPDILGAVGSRPSAFGRFLRVSQRLRGIAVYNFWMGLSDDGEAFACLDRGFERLRSSTNSSAI